MADLTLQLALAEDTPPPLPEPLSEPADADSGAAEDPPEDDELSAEGGGSAELVAGPRALDG